jgi:2-dehydro-3-deoxyphosphogluconate aldolase/(4S)-4-hydroxy-2-oxoglutarate aldolase
MPTGGITTANVAEYLAIKEIVAVGGTWLGKSSDIESGNWDAIRSAVRGAVELANAR